MLKSGKLLLDGPQEDVGGPEWSGEFVSVLRHSARQTWKAEFAQIEALILDLDPEVKTYSAEQQSLPRAVHLH
jgi:hypothetical protein